MLGHKHVLYRPMCDTFGGEMKMNIYSSDRELITDQNNDSIQIQLGSQCVYWVSLGVWIRFRWHEQG